MGRVVGFISQKGGVGKSTLARALAREAAAGGLTVKLADLDVQQATSVNWHRRRLDHGIEPRISVEAYKTAAQAIGAGQSFDMLVVDGPGRSSRGSLDIARSADLVVQPTGGGVDYPSALIRSAWSWPACCSRDRRRRRIRSNSASIRRSGCSH